MPLTVLMGYPRATLDTLPAVEELARMGREVASRAAAVADGRPRLEQGEPVPVIQQVASEIRADLIVVGTADRSWVSRIFRPSVGTSVATDAPCSVLVVREQKYETT
jgi:nucleotide-binding universal stress UspA family protein